jgi:N-acetylglucosaminyldiphosphoundecaprenol N-acetyl-beta-D-mannosaminyltransferase
VRCLSELQSKASDKATALIVTPNPEMLFEASRDPELMQVLQSADYALPDGAGIFVSYQIQESTLPVIFKYLMFPYWCLRSVIHSSGFRALYGERITGAYLTRDLLRFAEQRKIPVTIIDPIVYGNTHGDKAKRNSQSRIQEKILEKFPHINVTVLVADEAPSDIIHHGIVFATHGNGKQEKLLSSILEKNDQCGLLLGVGGSIDLLTGFRTPAPRFFQRFGGEWLYRLIKNPRKHIKRIRKVIFFLFSCFNK